ncbi:MAG: HEAT repeat domain-containing protein [Acidobacteria bacterium]|nr:HEAT repeat domain-containing protein [Acidobacteriota bacterium]
MAGSSQLEELTATLSSSDERAVETGLGLLQYGQANVAATQLGSLLTHFSPTIRRKALSIISSKNVPDCSPQVSVFLFLDNHVESLWRALDYLEQDDPNENYVRLKDLLEAPHAILRGTASARLLERGDSPHGEQALQVFNAFVETARSQEAGYRQVAAELLGRVPAGLDCQSALDDFLRDADPDVVRAAAISAGRVKQHSLAPHLVELVGDRRFRTEARRALASFGPDILPDLSRAVADPRAPLIVRRHLPRVFATIGGQQAADYLASNLGQTDLELQYQILRALSRIRLKQPDLHFDANQITPLTVKELRRYYRYAGIVQVVPQNGAHPAAIFLRRALAEQMNRKLEIIFRLIGLIYPPKEIVDAYYRISSGRRDLRANALEFLDSTLLNPLRQMLLPVIESRGSEKLLEQGRLLFGMVPPTYLQGLRDLLTDSDPWLQSCAVYAAADQGLSELDRLLEPLASSDDPLLQETVLKARQRLQAVAAARPSPGTIWKP